MLVSIINNFLLFPDLCRVKLWNRSKRILTENDLVNTKKRVGCPLTEKNNTRKVVYIINKNSFLLQFSKRAHIKNDDKLNY